MAIASARLGWLRAAALAARLGWLRAGALAGLGWLRAAVPARAVALAVAAVLLLPSAAAQPARQRRGPRATSRSRRCRIPVQRRATSRRSAASCACWTRRAQERAAA